MHCTLKMPVAGQSSATRGLVVCMIVTKHLNHWVVTSTDKGEDTYIADFLRTAVTSAEDERDSEFSMNTCRVHH